MRILELLKNGDSRFKKNLWFFLAAYFLVLFNYPLIRASSTSIFFETYGAKSTPVAWLGSVFFLAVAIYCCNWLQKRSSSQKVLLTVSSFSTFIFASGVLATAAYSAFIWKEIYIVIQVHLLLAYANSFFSKEQFKLLVGPVGAVGSLGGILGGLVTSYLSNTYGTEIVMLTGTLFVLLPGFIFLFTDVTEGINQEEKKKSPLSSLDTQAVRKYVFYIASIVALTQFIINIADFKFNIAFEKSVLTSAARTSYLGHVYTITNALTFIFQFIVLPLILPRISEKKLHLFIPASYLVCTGFIMFWQGTGVMAIAGMYIYLKASDYSFFSAAKEILYQPLKTAQKYGAKYLTDMLVYRVAKALIAAVLIYLQTSTILNVMMITFLIIWIMLVIRLFTLQRKLYR